MTADPTPTLERAAALIRAGLREARAALNAIRDPQAALDQARAFLAATLTEVRMALTDARAEQAARIVDEEGLSLTALGRRIGGVTKQRAGQEVSRGRRAKAAADEEVQA